MNSQPKTTKDNKHTVATHDLGSEGKGKKPPWIKRLFSKRKGSSGKRENKASKTTESKRKEKPTHTKTNADKEDGKKPVGKKRSWIKRVFFGRKSKPQNKDKIVSEDKLNGQSSGPQTHRCIENSEPKVSYTIYQVHRPT